MQTDVSRSGFLQHRAALLSSMFAPRGSDRNERMLKAIVVDLFSGKFDAIGRASAKATACTSHTHGKGLGEWSLVMALFLSVPAHAGLGKAPMSPLERQTQSTPAQSQNVPGGPHITSVNPLYPLRMQKIVIQGTGFGTADPFNGTSGYLMFVDLSHGNNITSYWQAGCPVYVCGTGGLSVYVTKWTPTEIDVEGFPQNYGTGTFGMCDCFFRSGDQIQIFVANPQMAGAIKQPPPAPYGFPAATQGAPFSTFTLTVSPWTNPVSIDSVSSIQAAQKQKIVINGSGFGSHEPFNGTSPFLAIKDVTADNWVAGFDGTTAVIVSKWTPNEIVLEGFGQGYGGRQALHNGDIVAVSVANPQMAGVVNNPQSEFQGAPSATKFVTVGVAGSAGPTPTGGGSGNGVGPLTLGSIFRPVQVSESARSNDGKYFYFILTINPTAGIPQCNGYALTINNYSFVVTPPNGTTLINLSVPVNPNQSNLSDWAGTVTEDAGSIIIAAAADGFPVYEVLKDSYKAIQTAMAGSIPVSVIQFKSTGPSSVAGIATNLLVVYQSTASVQNLALNIFASVDWTYSLLSTSSRTIVTTPQPCSPNKYGPIPYTITIP